MVWDVVVVGSGPAGSTAAIAARRASPDARVLLLDRADFPRDKACGDGIAPQAVAELARLGVPDVVSGYPQIRRLHIRAPRGGEVRGSMRRPAYVVPRTVLDARLRHAAVDAGAAVTRHHVREVLLRHDRVVLDGSIEARAVVGADGAESVVRRRLGLRRNGPGHVALALRGYARTPVGDPATEQLLCLSAAGWPAYAWSFPIGNGWSNVGYGEVLRRERPSRAHLLARLQGLLPGGTADLRDLAAHRLPLSTDRPCVGSGRVVLAGDALSMINPFTGEGIYYAVVTGAIAGAAATMGAHAARAAAAAVSARLGGHLRDTSAVAAAMRWSRVADAGVAAAAADRRVFEAIVDLGLGDGRLDGMTVGRVARALAPVAGPARRDE
ncbi:MAG: NAD(P)/FAD-dependent oxidoreductase [Actinomycetota bacterium]|nr:NAD(P)/FAD-dependent oxidoreductase [Actinomycetota bacterium]